MPKVDLNSPTMLLSEWNGRSEMETELRAYEAWWSETGQFVSAAVDRAGVLDEFPIERLLRESMILAIWEGAPHRQILDALQVMQSKRLHEVLFRELGAGGDPHEVRDLNARVDMLLGLGQEEMEAQSEGVFRDLAARAAKMSSRNERADREASSRDNGFVAP